MPVSAGVYYFAHHLREKTRRPGVVLIHGAGGTHLHWPPEIRRLPGIPVYALDLPGHGKTTGPGEQEIQAYSQKVLEWMDTLGLRRAILAGHSMGGAIALHIGIHHPERVAGLGLIGTGGRLRVSPTLLENISHPTTLQNALDDIVSWSFAPTADPRLVNLARRRFAEARPGVLLGDFQACDVFDVLADLEKISCPTTIVCGAEDRMTPVRYSQFLASKIPGAKFSVIPGAGHMVMLEKPKAVAEALAKMIAEHWG